jgi:hypothetical protein
MDRGTCSRAAACPSSRGWHVKPSMTRPVAVPHVPTHSPGHPIHLTTHENVKYKSGLFDPGEFYTFDPQNPTSPIQKAFFLRFCLFLFTTVFATLSNSVRDPLSYLMGEPVNDWCVGVTEKADPRTVKLVKSDRTGLAALVILLEVSSTRR